MDLSELYRSDRATPNGYIDIANDRMRTKAPASNSNSSGEVVLNLDDDNESVHYLKPISSKSDANGGTKRDYCNVDQESRPFLNQNAGGDASSGPIV